MEFQIFFLFFPTKGPFQLNNTSLTIFRNTHVTPNKASMISQRTLTTIQCKRIWFTVSSSQPHKKQQLGSCHPRFWSLSRVRIFPQVASQAMGNGKIKLLNQMTNLYVEAGNHKQKDQKPTWWSQEEQEQLWSWPLLKPHL